MTEDKLAVLKTIFGNRRVIDSGSEINTVAFLDELNHHHELGELHSCFRSFTFDPDSEDVFRFTCCSEHGFDKHERVIKLGSIHSITFSDDDYYKDRLWVQLKLYQNYTGNEFKSARFCLNYSFSINH